MKMVEQLDVADLKRAFKRYLESQAILDPREQLHHWDRFWRRLRDKCAIVERVR